MSQYPVTAYWDSYHFEVRLGTPRDPAADSFQGFNQLYQFVIPYTTSKQAFDLSAVENIAPNWNIAIDHNALTLTVTYTGGAFYDFSSLEDGYLRLFTMQDASEYFNGSFTTFQTNQLVTTQSGAAQNSSAGQYFAKQLNGIYVIDWLGYTANGAVYQIDEHNYVTLFNNGELRLGSPWDSPQGTQVPRLRTLQFTLVEGVESVINWNVDSGLSAAGFTVSYNSSTKLFELTYNANNGTDDYDLYQNRNGDLLLGNFTSTTNSFGDYSMTSASWVMSQYTASRSEPADGDVVGVYNGTYAELLASGSGGGGGSGTYHLSIYKDTNELRLGNPTTNAGDTYGNGTVYNFQIILNDPMNSINGFALDGSLTGWNITSSNAGGQTTINGDYTAGPSYDMTALGDSELLLGTILGAMIDWNQTTVSSSSITATSMGMPSVGTYAGTVDGSYSASSGGGSGTYHLSIYKDTKELRLGNPTTNAGDPYGGPVYNFQIILNDPMNSINGFQMDPSLTGWNITSSNAGGQTTINGDYTAGPSYDKSALGDSELLFGTIQGAMIDWNQTTVSSSSIKDSSAGTPSVGTYAGTVDGSYSASSGGGGGGSGTYHLSIYKDSNELRLGNPTNNAGDTYSGGTVFEFSIFFDGSSTDITGFQKDASLTGWDLMTSTFNGGTQTSLTGYYVAGGDYDMTALGDSELLLGTFQGASLDWNTITVMSSTITPTDGGQAVVGNTLAGIVEGTYSASSGGAGDPHIQPVFGKKYDLPHVPEVFILYDNLNKEFPVTIKGKCWFLPESRYISQIKKMLANGYYNRAQKIAKILQTSTFFRYIEFVCGPEHMIVDMEKLTLCEYTNAYDLHHCELPTLNEYVNNKFITIGKLRHASEGFFKRSPAYSTLERNITLNGPFGTVSIKLLRDSRNIMNRNGIVLRASGFKGNEVGALIRRYIKYSDFSTNYTYYSEKSNEPTAYDFEEVIISEAGGCTMYSYDDNESPIVIKDYTNKSMNAVF